MRPLRQCEHLRPIWTLAAAHGAQADQAEIAHDVPAVAGWVQPPVNYFLRAFLAASDVLGHGARLRASRLHPLVRRGSVKRRDMIEVIAAGHAQRLGERGTVEPSVAFQRRSHSPARALGRRL
ncbi:hypothetical protein HNQ08_004394 [Deinococcus humi]|uniref:Uncharacterized protein n=1 Tax=Deinococcus humi TaxID=662880 RepID=A0A7W8JYR2_9DEIO|nr:hypothetical protein [Deinococcus humi]